MNSYTFNKFIDTLFFYLDKLEKEYSSEDVIKEFKKILKKAYFTEGAIIRDISEEDEKIMIARQEGKEEGTDRLNHVQRRTVAVYKAYRVLRYNGNQSI